MLFVPDHEREHTAQLLHDFRAVFLIAVENDLRVAACPEYVTAFHEYHAQLLEIVDLAVENDHHAAVLIFHRLTAGGEVDDGKTAESERTGIVVPFSIEIEALGIGTAMDDPIRHSL